MATLRGSYRQEDYRKTVVARHGLAAIAGVATEAALTYPLDTLKTLLQVSLISTFPIQMHMEFDLIWFFDFVFPFFCVFFFASVFGMCCAANCLLQNLFGGGLESCDVLHTVRYWRLASFRIWRKSDSSLFTGLQFSEIYLAQLCMSRLIHSGSEGNFSVRSEHPLFYLALR